MGAALGGGRQGPAGRRQWGQPSGTDGRCPSKVGSGHVTGGRPSTAARAGAGGAGRPASAVPRRPRPLLSARPSTGYGICRPWCKTETGGALLGPSTAPEGGGRALRRPPDPLPKPGMIRQLRPPRSRTGRRGLARARAALLAPGGRRTACSSRSPLGLSGTQRSGTNSLHLGRSPQCFADSLGFLICAGMR